MTIKKISLIVLSLFFGLSLLTISLVSVTTRPVGAEVVVEEGIGQETGEEMVSKEEEVQEPEVNYYLPYPGILPDHPLYWLKMIRDRTILSLTRRVEHRLERMLLYSDKRIGAAEALIEGNKAELGVTTATKAEKYLDEAVALLPEVKKAGKATPELKDKLNKAVMKHESLLQEFLDQISDQNKTVVEEMIQAKQQNRERIREQFK